MYVYRIRSESHPKEIYTGVTAKVQARLAAHNAGQSPHTAKFKPWHLEVFVWFADDSKARQFEKYLKSGSGRAFGARHF
jgi:putative endonuclease